MASVFYFLWDAGDQNADPGHRAVPHLLGLSSDAGDLHQVRTGHLLAGRVLDACGHQPAAVHSFVHQSVHLHVTTTTAWWRWTTRLTVPSCVTGSCPRTSGVPCGAGGSGSHRCAAVAASAAAAVKSCTGAASARRSRPAANRRLHLVTTATTISTVCTYWPLRRSRIRSVIRWRGSAVPAPITFRSCGGITRSTPVPSYRKPLATPTSKLTAASRPSESLPAGIFNQIVIPANPATLHLLSRPLTQSNLIMLHVVR